MGATVEFKDLQFLLRTVRVHQPFDRETELQISREVRRGSARARDKLILHNLALVVATAARFAGRGQRLEDLVQEGICGLIKAVERFEPERGYRFGTYALWWIRAYLVRATAQRPLREGEVRTSEVSLDEEIPGTDATRMETLIDDAPLPEEHLAREQERRQLRAALARVQKPMGPVAWEIVTSRLLEDDEPRTLRQIGEARGISRERVRQIENSTRAMLARYLAGFEEAA
jgi:RNA polymerase primary sigma factor